MMLSLTVILQEIIKMEGYLVYGYRVEFMFSNGENSYVDVYSPRKLDNPTPFDLLDFDVVKIDWSNVVMMKLNYLSCEIN